MALRVREPVGSEYAIAEQELQDHILNTYGSYDSEVDLFRPNLADQHKVGFFSQDRTSQTDLTEIVDLKEMTEVLQVLLQDVAKLRRDINFTKHVMQADYEAKLQEKSLELYCRINERVAELEKMHEERVGTLRRAFRQQLSDAIARVAVLYSKNLERKIRHEKKKHDSDADRLQENYKELQATIQRNENVIQMLRMQLAQHQKEPSIHESPSGSSGRPSAATPPTPEEESISLKSKSPSINHEAEELREELDKLSKKYEQLEDTLKARKEETAKLNNNIDQLNEKLSQQKMENEQMRFENNQLKHGMQQDKESSKKMFGDMMERQKAEFDRVMQEQIRKAKEESLNAAQRETQSLKDSERDKIKLLVDQKKLLEEQLAKERAKNSAKSKEDIDTDKLRKTEDRMKEEIQRLKREIERIHKTWEKKFAILQQSLHALKDESYLRQTLQRQSAALHHAAVSYSVDTPVGIVPSSKSSPMKRPLPEISKFKAVNPGTGAAGPPHERDFLSYTVSAPSGRGTAMFSVEDNQIMSEQDKDDVPTDIVPLPDPPSKKPPSRCSNDGRPDSRVKVVVVPHVTA